MVMGFAWPYAKPSFLATWLQAYAKPKVRPLAFDHSRWQDLDLDAGVWRVRQALARVSTYLSSDHARKIHRLFQEPKTGYSRRIIPIPEDIIEELKHHKARQAQEKLLFGQGYRDQGLVFCQPDGHPIAPRTFTGAFARLLPRAAVPHIRFHDGRHTFATIMLELGESPKTVHMILGHSEIATTLDTYSHVSLVPEKRAAARLNIVLRG